MIPLLPKEWAKASANLFGRFSNEDRLFIWLIFGIF